MVALLGTEVPRHQEKKAPFFLTVSLIAFISIKLILRSRVSQWNYSPLTQFPVTYSILIILFYDWPFGERGVDLMKF